MLTIETEGRYRNKITLTQGNSGTLKIKVRDARNKPLVLTAADTAVLTVKRDINDLEPALCVPMDKDGQFVFRPEDTANLACGKYTYDVKVTLASGNVYNVIAPAQFVLERGVS